MELSVREAATLLGRSPRTVRSQLHRGDLPGTKRHGRWRIERRHLPLTEAQRRALAAKAESIRQAVDKALPGRLACTPTCRRRSIADLDAFRLGAELLAEVRGSGAEVLREAAWRRVVRLLELGLLALAEAVAQFEREAKLGAIERARATLARATGVLLLESGIPPAEPVGGWVARLETEVIPAVAGFARWADRLGRRGR